MAYAWSLKPAAAPDRPLDALTGEDATRAWEAVWALAAAPDGPRRLGVRFPPVREPKPETIQAWIADLDHPTFARREAAETALAKAGRFSEPAVRRALAGKPSAEARQRLEKIVAGISHRPTAEDIAHSRAVHALELANTEAARKVLAEWAAGAEGAWLTADARAALGRQRARDR